MKRQRPYEREWQRAIIDIQDYFLGATEQLCNLSGCIALDIAHQEIEAILLERLKIAQAKEEAYDEQSTAQR